jgi:hypothetical protein
MRASEKIAGIGEGRLSEFLGLQTARVACKLEVIARSDGTAVVDPLLGFVEGKAHSALLVFHVRKVV